MIAVATHHAAAVHALFVPALHAADRATRDRRRQPDGNRAATSAGYGPGMLRAATADDFDAIAAITAPYVETTAIHFAYVPPTAAELRAQWSPDGRYPWLCALDGPDVVGYAKAGAWRDRAAYQWTAEVGFYLAPSHRGRGFGTRLLAALVDELTARGFHAAIGGVTLPNPASVALLEKAGFAPVGVFAQVGWKLGAWHDVGFWQRALGGEGPPGMLPPP